jgi:hypothetical protein
VRGPGCDGNVARGPGYDGDVVRDRDVMGTL